MIQIKDKTKCVGCGCCAFTCPSQCITLKPDNEGFIYPYVDEGICIKCGKCHQVCLVENPLPRPSIPFPKTMMAAYIRNDDTRMASSSGGIFPALAHDIIKKGGVVYGAAFISNDRVQHIRVSSYHDIKKLQGSKYVQSDIYSIIPTIIKDIKNGLPVLFSGTPCQVKALNNLLGNAPPKNLLSIEVVCHGVPSPMVFSRYMKEMKASSISFRNKERGWSDYDVVIHQADGRTIKEKASQNVYMKGLIQNLTLRPSCSSCPARSFSSRADITLGDLWGIQHIAPQLFDDKGTSVVFLHSPKGTSAWHDNNEQFVTKELDDYAEVIKHNPCISSSLPYSKKRDAFFSKSATHSTIELLTRYTSCPDSIFKIIASTFLKTWIAAWKTYVYIRDHISQSVRSRKS